MSVGVHRLWKDHFVQRLAPNPKMKILDVAGGTGKVLWNDSFLYYHNFWVNTSAIFERCILTTVFWVNGR